MEFAKRVGNQIFRWSYHSDLLYFELSHFQILYMVYFSVRFLPFLRHGDVSGACFTYETVVVAGIVNFGGGEIFTG